MFEPQTKGSNLFTSCLERAVKSIDDKLPLP